MANEVELGSKIKDKVTGFEGIAIARTCWLNGCTRLAVQSTELKDGKPTEEYWIDEGRVDVLPDGKIEVSEADRTPPAGPRNDARRAADPRL